MEPYTLGEEGTLPSEVSLPPFSESQGLNCSDTLNRDLGPSTRDLLYAGLGSLDLDPSLPPTDMPSEVLEDNLDTLSLYSGKDSDSAKLLEEYADSESQTALQDLGLGTLKVPKEVDEGGRATSGSTRKGKRQHSSPQNPLLDCSLCGKVFSSASSLSKHYLTHSQERKHVCKVCSKAFKRQDHLTGHMLTHQKTKPFVCIEQGCSKSYCDYRSLRRHYEVQHGVCILKEAPPEEEAYGEPPHTHDPAGQPPPSSLRSLGPPEARSPGSILPNRDLLRCIVSSIVHQKIPPPSATVGPSDSEGRSTACACPTTLGSSSCTPTSTPAASGSLASDIPEETHPLQKESAAEVFTAVQSRASENGAPDPPESELESESPRLQRPSSLEGWPESGSLPACLPLFRGHSVPSGSQPSSHNFQWLRSLPGCPKNKGGNVFVVHKPPAVPARDGSEGGPAPNSTPTTVEPSPSLGTSQEDLLPFTPSVLKAPSEACSDTRHAPGEDDNWVPKKSKPDCEPFPWQSSGEPDMQTSGGIPADATPLFRQLLMKSQESLVSHEQMQVFQMIAKSQRIFSHTQVATASAQRPGSEGKQAALKSLQGPWPPQPPPPAPTVDPLQVGPGHSEPEGSPVRRRKTMPALSRETSPSGPRRDTKLGPKVASAPPSLTGPALDSSRNPDISSLAKQLRSSKGTLDLGDILPTAGPRQPQLGGDEPAGTQLVGKQVENGPTSGATRSEKGPACPRGGGYRLFSGHPRTQRFSGFRKEKVKMDVCCAASPSQVAMASFSSAGPPADPTRDMKSKLTIFNRIQGGNISRLSHPMKEENTVGGCHQPNGGPTDWAESRSTYICKNCSQMFYTEKGLNSHMCFHSDQWPSPRGKQEQQGQEKDGEERDSKESGQYRKRKKRPQPKALFVSPASSGLGEPSPGGYHQSCLRSPVFLVDHLLKGLFQCSPYTPPPMLSPIREGSGLYFNTLCSISRTGPHLISSVLDQVDGSFSICMVKDDTKISIEPHINVGSRFQAEIPELQERLLAGADEHVASLVWKPWGDVMSNPETQDRVTELCNVACSSVMPGGGTNLELALHCLHEAQGSVQVALETLLLRGPQKPRTHPLADYRYTGSDIWTPMEKRLFKKAFCAHKKDFYLIHKTIQTKSVAQCVEYYYIWKKMIKFDCGRTPGLEKRVRRELDEAERTEEKVTCSPRERPSHRPTPELKIKTKSYRRESILNSSPSAAPKRTPEPPGSVESQGVFPCRECERVFDKIKSRNAHMKRHRLQEHVEPVRVKWPVKPYPMKEEEEEEEEELGADMGPLQW